MAIEFIHLRTHTEFSLVDGLVRVKDLVKSAKQEQMPAVAITDQVNLFALLKFYKAAVNEGIKPLLGADIWLYDADQPEHSLSRLTLLSMNNQGYQNLTELIAQAYNQGQQQVIDKAIIDKSWLLNKTDGLIALSGGRSGVIGQAILSGNHQPNALLVEWMALFPERFYLEIQRTGRVGEEEVIQAQVALSQSSGCPLVATNEVMFIKADDFAAHEARVCINQGRVLEDPNRPREYTEQQYFRSVDEMKALFQDIPSALKNTVEIAKRCNTELDLGAYYLPQYPVPEGMLMDDYFRQITYQGLDERLDILLDKQSPDYEQQKQVYYDRLEFELDIIIQMGFPGYFLIVMDFIRWAKENDVPVGPGRGSGAGSLVAYAQKITDLDPLEYDLLFERFLNPERVSMPDFDIDFCMDNRDKVIDYIAETYGRDAVSQIVTFGTMAAKAVVRDVARVQDKPFSLGDKLAKLIPFDIGMTLSKAVETEPALQNFIANDADAEEIMDMAYKLEGITRGVGKHAGGVVIAPTKLTDFSATRCEEDGTGLVTQFDKNDVEEAGLVKFDLLGLRTLTIIDWAVKNINEQHEQQAEELLDISRIDLTDKATFELLQSASTTAVFQLESDGMKDLVARLLPSHFEDIVALVALYRPGPLESGMVTNFINRKHGREELAWPAQDCQLESLKPVLETTYGIILYQEQVMKIAQVMANYSLGEADMLRRAMGKKKPEEMDKQRSSFLEGSEKNGIDSALAGNIFDLVEKFAGYGFNKSHSAAYALLSYQTAWLKTHYPAEFMAAVLSSDMQNTDKVVILFEECKRMNITPSLPDINQGHYMFKVNPEGQILYGLGAVKGLGEGIIDEIVRVREAQGAFTDIFDFCQKVGAKNLNKRALESLISAGAFDSLATVRSVLWASIADALKAANQEARNQDAGMFDLFGGEESAVDTEPYQQYKNVRNWTDKERLSKEKNTLGLYITGHLIDEYQAEIRQFSSSRISELRAIPKRTQILAGILVSARATKTKKGDPICFVTLDDKSARIDVALFGDLYLKAQAADLLKSDNVLLIEAEVTEDRYSESGGLKVRAERIQSLVQARLKQADKLEISCSAKQLAGQQLMAFSQVLQTYRQPDGLPLSIQYSNNDAQADFNLADNWRVLPSDDLLLALMDLFGSDSVQIKYN